MNRDSDITIDNELERLINSNANVLSQYVIFKNGTDELFAINVMKVEELLVYKDLNVSRDPGAGYVVGVSKVRDNMVNIVHFDRWIGKGEIAEDKYELLMLCNYGDKRVGILIKDVMGIMDIDSTELYEKNDKEGKISYVTELDYNGEKKLCLVIDSDKLLLDTHPDIEEKIERGAAFVSEKVRSSKKVIIAEDSRLLQRSLKKLFEKLELEALFFENGKEAVEGLEKMNEEDIGIIITDIEMPVKDGFYVLEKCKRNDRLKDIPVIVNSNMANSTLADRAKKLGADEIVTKPDMKILAQTVKKLMLT